MKLTAKILLTLIISALLISSWSVFVFSIAEKENTLFSFLMAFGLTVVGSIPIFLAAWFILINMLVRPIKSLGNTVKVITSGNLGVRTALKSKDELGELSQNIDHMIQNLANTAQEMANSLRETIKKEAALSANVEELEVAKKTILSTVDDLNNQKLKLEQEKNKAEAILRSITDGVVAVNKFNQIILFNKSAANILGFKFEEVYGRDYKFFIKFLDEKEPNIPVEDILKKSLFGQPSEGDNKKVIVCKDGRKIPVSDSSAPIWDANSNSQGAVIVFRDISREKQLDHMKDEFVSVASHELRTPMTAIRGLVSMIFEGDYGPINKELEEPLQDIGTSTERLINLVNDMLDVSRIEAGRMKFNYSKFSIKELLEKESMMLKPLARQKNLILELTEINEGQVWGDKDKIIQVFTNLVGNSFKFTDQGGIYVKSKIENGFYFVSVSDTGIGISLENQEKLFGKFQQISTEQVGRPAGTGLGLYISREIIRKMKGDLWIESSVIGKGSVFCFKLPLLNNSQIQQPGQTSSVEQRPQSLQNSLHPTA